MEYCVVVLDAVVEPAEEEGDEEESFVPVAEAREDFEVRVAPTVPAKVVGPSSSSTVGVPVASPPAAVPVLVFVAVSSAEVSSSFCVVVSSPPPPPPALSSNGYRGASTAAAAGSNVMERSTNLRLLGQLGALSPTEEEGTHVPPIELKLCCSTS